MGPLPSVLSLHLKEVNIVTQASHIWACTRGQSPFGAQGDEGQSSQGKEFSKFPDSFSDAEKEEATKVIA